MAFISESTGQSVAATTETVVYNGSSNTGVPNNSGAVLIGLIASNIGSTSANVSFYKRVNSSSSASDNIYIIKSAPVPVGSTLEVVAAKVVLNQYDRIFITVDVSNTIQATASVLENS